MQDNYPTIRAHVGAFSDPGTESCDFQGEKFIGDAQGDHHSTAFEIDNPPQALIDVILAEAPAINAKTTKEIAPGVWTGVRIGVWDKVAPTG